MKKPIPSLSSSGWIASSAEASSKLLSYFFTTEYSQSSIYAGNLHSLPYLVAQYGDKPDEMASQCETAINELFSAYFEDLVVSVTATGVEDATNYNLDVKVVLVSNGERQTLSTLLQISDGEFHEIVEAING